MSLVPVEWVLVVSYGRSAHRATYGRIRGTKYTKDYIQLSRSSQFRDEVASAFGCSWSPESPIAVEYCWPGGHSFGELVYESSDRPHLKWETIQGAPEAWRMVGSPSANGPQTIPGEPSHTTESAAESEFAQLGSRGAGEPLLIAVRLRENRNALHLRVFLKGASAAFSWCNYKKLPDELIALADAVSHRKATASKAFSAAGFPIGSHEKEKLKQLLISDRMLDLVDELSQMERVQILRYLRSPATGLFFDPEKNHDAFAVQSDVMVGSREAQAELIAHLEAGTLRAASDDAAAEHFDYSPNDVDQFRRGIALGSFLVEDSYAAVKTRGSAQRAFGSIVKKNYGYRCAITGISDRNFLVASHIVPWSEDKSIRLDPSNGICLSVLVDRAFELGYLQIGQDMVVRIDHDKIGEDSQLRDELSRYDQKRIANPSECPPNADFLRRRIELSSGHS